MIACHRLSYFSLHPTLTQDRKKRKIENKKDRQTGRQSGKRRENFVMWLLSSFWKKCLLSSLGSSGRWQVCRCVGEVKVKVIYLFCRMCVCFFLLPSCIFFIIIFAIVIFLSIFSPLLLSSISTFSSVHSSICMLSLIHTFFLLNSHYLILIYILEL